MICVFIVFVCFVFLNNSLLQIKLSISVFYPVSFTPSRGTTVSISSTDADCNICLEGRSPKCDRSFVFSTAATVVLKCPTSKFMVEFSRSIGEVSEVLADLIKQYLHLFVVKLTLISVLRV